MQHETNRWVAIHADPAFQALHKQKTEYEMAIGDWSSDVCSSDLPDRRG